MFDCKAARAVLFEGKFAKLTMSQSTLIKRSVLTLFSAFLLGGSAAMGAEASPPAQAANAGPNDSYNIRAFGAVGDAKSLDSPSINLAIEACAKAGGGTVYLPPGTYLCGSIHLKSPNHLYFDEGATILGGPQDKKAYGPEEPFDGPGYQDGGHTYFHN